MGVVILGVGSGSAGSGSCMNWTVSLFFYLSSWAKAQSSPAMPCSLGEYSMPSILMHTCCCDRSVWNEDSRPLALRFRLGGVKLKWRDWLLRLTQIRIDTSLSSLHSQVCHCLPRVDGLAAVGPLNPRLLGAWGGNLNGVSTFLSTQGRKCA